MKSILLVCLAAATLVAAGPWSAGSQSDVRVTCPLTIGGSFEAKTAALSGSVTASASGSPALDGSFAVDLRTLDSGIVLRNEHLRETYLEVNKGPGYDHAVVSEITLKGLDPGAQGKGSFAGSLALHGTRHAVNGSVDVRQAGGVLRVKASFPVNLSDYGIAPPRYLGVGAKNTVQVQVAFEVTQ